MAGLGLTVASPMLLADTLRNKNETSFEHDKTLVFHVAIGGADSAEKAERKLKLVSLAGSFKKSGKIVKIISETVQLSGSSPTSKYTYVFDSIASKNKYLELRKAIVS